MFICKDCGTKYDKKPDYCECGSDEFIEETSVINNLKTEKKLVNNISEQWLINNIPSLIIFVICILLSVFIFCIKDKIQENVEPVKQKEQISKPVNWTLFEDDLNSVSVYSSEETNLKKEKSKNTIVPLAKDKTVDISPKTLNPPKDQNVKNSTKNNISKKNNLKIESKEKVIKKTNNAELKKQSASKENVEEMKKQAQTEIYNYKNILATTFYKKIDFTGIIGQGSCEVSFKVDKTGQLINKAFSKQSQNTTLNDTVFYAVKNISKVLAPPNSYDGETFRLIVSFNNGNYAVKIE